MAKKKAVAPKVDPYLEGLMGKLLDRLVGLEKKMDTLLSALAPSKTQAPPQETRRERQLYEAVCAECHKVCEVPFRPTEERPVYCKECWAKRKHRPHGAPVKSSTPGMPVLTPVAMPQKTAERSLEPPPAAPRSAKKSKPTKPSKKKK